MTVSLYRVCDVEGCTNTPDARGLCNRHYRQWRKRGRCEPVVHALPLAEVIRLRRLVGVPDTGPTPEQWEAWNRLEAHEDGRVAR